MYRRCLTAMPTFEVLVALVGLHVLAALKYMLLDRNGVFQRMWF